MSATTDAYDVVTAALAMVTGYQPPGGRGDWRCPAHDDRKTSLSVTRGDERVLLCCHANCANEAVVEALGLQMRDLYDRPRTNHNSDRAQLYPSAPGPVKDT